MLHSELLRAAACADGVGDVRVHDEEAVHLAGFVAQSLNDPIRVAVLRSPAAPIPTCPVFMRVQLLAGLVHAIEKRVAFLGPFRKRLPKRLSHQLASAERAAVVLVGYLDTVLGPTHQRDAKWGLREEMREPALVYGRPEDPQLRRDLGERGAVPHGEPLEKVRDLLLHRLFGDPEAFGDLFVLEAGGHKAEQGGLPVRQTAADAAPTELTAASRVAHQIATERRPPQHACQPDVRTLFVPAGRAT